MKNNEELQKKVQEAIQWESLLHSAEIGVIAIDGVVTLSGIVDSYSKKAQAEDAVKQVDGVLAVVDNIAISQGKWGINTDNEIASQVINAFQWNTEIANEKISVVVEKGWVTLEGEVSWNHQREAARAAIANLIGVKGVINRIAIRPGAEASVNTKDIMEALVRSGSLNAEGIRLEAVGHMVILSGTIDTWYEKEEAARIVWNAPGVVKVDNRLDVTFRR